jgi:hypothetical protein
MIFKLINDDGLEITIDTDKVKAFELASATNVIQ